MSPIRTRRNLYRGINAHLHSYWQAQGGWNGFHASHIVYLTTALKADLLPLGYTLIKTGAGGLSPLPEGLDWVSIEGHPARLGGGWQFDNRAHERRSTIVHPAAGR